MKRTVLVLTLTVAGCLGAVGLLSANAAPTNSPPCTPTRATLDGQTVYDLCGPATATVSVGGKTYSFRNGYCKMRKGVKSLQLFLGILAPTLKGNGGKPLFDLTAEHFGGTVFSAGGTVSASYAGKKLVGDLTRDTGHFPNQGLFKGLTTKFTGTWNCHGVVYQAP